MKKILVPTTLSLLFTQASSAFAQFGTVKPPTGINIFTNLGSLISNAITLIMFIAALATFIYLVWGGIEWITAGGDKAGTEAARSKITNAFIGLFVVFAAWAIVKLLETFFGICVLGCPIVVPTPS